MGDDMAPPTSAFDTIWQNSTMIERNSIDRIENKLLIGIQIYLNFSQKNKHDQRT
jgi:hypothetical protein